MEEVIRDDGGVSEVEAKSVIFTRLKDLSLSSLPTLKSLYQHPLLFPSVETVEVYSCPRLRRLPFDSNTATNRLNKIEGEESWWNMLQWEDSTVEDLFTPYFQTDKYLSAVLMIWNSGHQIHFNPSFSWLCPVRVTNCDFGLHAEHGAAAFDDCRMPYSFSFGIVFVFRFEVRVVQ
ncbi:putative disease resistance protein [Vitis vinifera]|uniref:Putative disease resistance protein n=1 Tax=Vitis vinifera TaxID=29760 RepID=A0A438CK32_VITVI|nr:putative disease resistance protein [Vitis vinifera]